MQIVKGHLQAYDWGPVDGLAAWTAATGGPQAELWFGTHPNGPSPLRDAEGTASTATGILTKILAAARPLSLQIHPREDFAAEHFASQRGDPSLPALLADPFAKAEMLIAVEPFVILEGFRDPGVSAAVFDDLAGPLMPAATCLHDGDIGQAIRHLLALDPAAVSTLAPGLPDAFAQAGLNEHAQRVIGEVVDCFPGDPGVFVAAMLHSRTLAPGEAVYVDPGTVHAYVRGTGIEVMTNSDNVLRLGLTSKVVAVDPALEALDVTAQPHPCVPVVDRGTLRFAHESAPFEVTLVHDDFVNAPAGSARTIVCLAGTATTQAGVLRAGEALLLSGDDDAVDVAVAGQAILAQQVDPQHVAG